LKAIAESQQHDDGDGSDTELESKLVKAKMGREHAEKALEMAEQKATEASHGQEVAEQRVEELMSTVKDLKAENKKNRIALKFETKVKTKEAERANKLDLKVKEVKAELNEKMTHLKETEKARKILQQQVEVLNDDDELDQFVPPKTPTGDFDEMMARVDTIMLLTRKSQRPSTSKFSLPTLPTEDASATVRQLHGSGPPLSQR